MNGPQEGEFCMKLTVYYDGQFWVGVLEQEEDGKLKAARYLFGAEPKDAEVLEFVERYALRLWERVGTSVRVEAGMAERRINPKRMLREAQ
jgi:hypothetical protein